MDASSNARHAHLETRPEARSFSIESLLGEIRSGKIRLPPLQRPLRWEEEDRLQLFDSIYRGFPIGNLLFWVQSGPRQTLHIGRLTLEAQERSDVLWVIDGQQRLVTLSDALLAPQQERALRFDLEERQFVYGTALQLPAPRWLPLAEAASSKRLLLWAHRQLGENSPNLEIAFDVGRRLLEYQVPAYIIESEAETVVRLIFERINSTGKALKGAEIFDALHGGRGTGRPASLGELAISLQSEGFGSLPSEDALLSLLVVSGKDPAKSHRQIEDEEAGEALQATESALRHVLRFLRDDAGFPHRLLLPYQQPLLPLALFFHRHPEPTSRIRNLLSRWLWRGSLLGRFRGDTTTLRRMLRAVGTQDDPERACQSLIGEIESRPASVPELSLRPYNLGHARTKLQLAGLAALAPRSLETGEVLDLLALCEQSEGPTQALSTASAPAEAKGLAARLFHPPLPRRKLLEKLIDCRDGEVLRSHAISDQAMRILSDGGLGAFLKQREQDLEIYLSDYFASRASWNPVDRDRPSLASLVVEDSP